ncbi:hypothetical protein [Streptomyces sp. enrichment culture]|uniref:hypothetical protein n=1 Tax=Streptomyces sp. enrichment culture TaxID=1795815 RepID=UPI003F552108
MIRIVTHARLAQLVDDARAAREQARQAGGEATEVFRQHVRELAATTDRVERSEATASEVGAIFARATEELSAAQQELLRKDIEICRLHEELARGPAEGDTLTVLMHYGEPHTIYASHENAHADSSTHGVPADGWVPAGERPAAESTWRCEAFSYDPACNGFRRANPPVRQALEGAA